MEQFKEKEEKKNKCVIMPDSQFKKVWNPTIIAALFYTATLTPYRVAFMKEEYESRVALIVELMVDIIFIFDLVLTFFFAYERKDDTIETSKKKIAGKYLRTVFVIDLFSCIPSQLLESETNFEQNVWDGSFK